MFSTSCLVNAASWALSARLSGASRKGPFLSRFLLHPGTRGGSNSATGTAHCLGECLTCSRVSKITHRVDLAKAWDRSHWILDNLDWPLYQRADLHSPLEFPR